MANISAFANMILDAIEEPALIIHAQRTLAANRAARALLGEAIIGRDLRFAIRHPLALDIILSQREAEIDVVGIGSADRPWHLSSRPLADGASLVRFTDRSAVQAAERMRTDFVANASHELRTPLATIIGYAETLAEDAPIDDPLRIRFGETIRGEATRMLRIVEDLMSLSRIEANRFNAPEESVDLAEVACLSIEHATPLLERGKCTIKPDIDRDIPAVRGDFAQLLQLTDNLIGNALRYGCTAQQRDIDVIIRREGQRTLLIVRDHGEGISAHHLPRLTERFYRIDAARSRNSGGTGLGLAIVKHIVERHRGTIEIRSTLGIGTEVTVALPLSQSLS
ncbi:MAG: ATP-binding protein [Pseudomonadota bacterium]|nr:ATP-binding protein [Pseudomonadota bacterium]